MLYWYFLQRLKMKTLQRNIKKHLFICVNQKASGDCCGAKEAELLLKAIKAELKDRDLWDDYKVTKSGCLGPCSQGITATLYPNNLLITELSINSKDELIELMLKTQ